MRKTQFAGLMVLRPDESILMDGGAFIGRDREVIDNLLRVGAKTHRHDEAPGLAPPDEAPEATTVASGGLIPAEVSLALGITLEDARGGETTLGPTIVVATENPIEAPPGMPTASADYSAGSLLPDAYYYAYSFCDSAGGETPIGPAALVELAPGFPNGRVMVGGFEGPMASAGAASWRLYRARGGAEFHYLASGVADTFADDGSVEPNCDVFPLDDFENSTRGENTLLVTLPSGGSLASASQINLYASELGDFTGDVLLDTFPLSSAGQTVAYSELDYLEGQPPDVNLSIGGVGKIDAELELQNYRWRLPVATHGDLPAGEQGDVRLVLDSGRLYGALMVGGAAAPQDWTPLGGGGGAGAGLISVCASGDTTQTRIEPDPFFDPFDGDELDDAWNTLMGTPTVGGGEWSSTGVVMWREDVSFTNGRAVLHFRSTEDWDSVMQYAINVRTSGDPGDGGHMLSVSVSGGGLSVNSIADSFAFETPSTDPDLIEEDTEYWLLLDMDGQDFTVELHTSDPLTESDPPVWDYNGTIDTPLTHGGIGLAWGDDGTGAVKGFWVEQKSPPCIEDVERLIFEPSGGVSIHMDELGSGAARILIGAEPGGGGGGGGTPLAISESGEPAIPDIEELQFHASGDAVVGVTDVGGGVGRVTIFASAEPGPAGPPGASGAPGPPGASGLPGRVWASAMAAGLASGASANVTWGDVAGARLVGISTSKRARVRVYGDEDARAADLGRAPDEQPEGDHGVGLDYLLDLASGGQARVAPTVDIHSTEDPPQNELKLNVTNMDAAGDVHVAFLYLPTEVV